ncbi:hypothetical protein SIXOD_v1c16740 [Spiroplasma ixodetis Y32]|nr:hypothetical protein SIXOD_v1c16740 [Spiroplasma ixodetis Y32]
MSVLPYKIPVTLLKVTGIQKLSLVLHLFVS